MPPPHLSRLRISIAALSSIAVSAFAGTPDSGSAASIAQSASGIDRSAAGLARRGNADLASQAVFAGTSEGLTAVSVANSDGTTGAMTLRASSASGHRWTVNENGNLFIDTTVDASSIGKGSSVSYAQSATGLHEFTLAVSLKMSGTGSNNLLGIGGGNGETVGNLYVMESGIFWNGTSDRLYGADSTGCTTDDFIDLRMVYRFADAEADVAAGYYVWFNGQLIGEALSGTVLDLQKDRFLIGDTVSHYVTLAEIASISFDETTAWAPASIPEPSAFGLLAGTVVLAVAAARRRRRSRAN